MPYTQSLAKAQAKYYQKIKDKKVSAYKERYENDEEFRKREQARHLANYYTRKERKLQQLLSETSTNSENSENSENSN